MLSHNRQCIVESLTRVPSERGRTWFHADSYESGAVHNFSNLLVCMGDKPAQEVQRLSSQNAILSLASEDKAFKDEIYVQLMKQLTRNPSPRSAELGWELFRRLCESAPPPTDGELIAFVRAFIKESLPQLPSSGSSADVTNNAKSCLAALDNQGILGKMQRAAASVLPAAQSSFFYTAFPCCAQSRQKSVTPPMSPRRHFEDGDNGHGG